jgi:hypothetical protein
VGIREKLNENPAITTGATIGIIVIALIFIIWQLMGSGTSYAVPTSAYYTTDDSSPEAALAAMFEDDINKIPPFKSKDGKEAYKAMVFSCDGGKTKWVAYLQRYTPEAQKAAEEAQKAAKGNDPAAAMNAAAQMEGVMMTGIEVKKPGGKAWLKQMTPQASTDVMNVKCPDGTQNNIESVNP